MVRVPISTLIDSLLTFLPQGATLEDDDGDSSDESFHYPGASPLDTIRPSSRSSNSTDYFNSRPGPARVPRDLTPQLSQAPEFRVPTHEAPQKMVTPRWTPPTPHQVHAQWERDETVHECRDCQRRFNFLTRRVSSYFPSWLASWLTLCI